MTITQKSILFALACVVGCGEEDPVYPPAATEDVGGIDASSDATADTALDLDTGSDASPEVAPLSPIDVTVRFLDPLSSEGVSGLDVEVDGVVAITDASGSATVQVAELGPFDIVVSGADVPDYHVVGVANGEAMSYVSLISTRTLMDQVYGMLGVTADAAAGTVVVGVDYRDLSPAVGAQVALDASHGPAFTFGGFGPIETDTIEAGSASFISFPNVVAGATSVTVVPPDGDTCVYYDAGAQTAEVEVHPDAVTVVQYFCEPGA